MRTGQLALLMALFTLSGCDRITGADRQQVRDAEAVGYACRVSQKTPEDCMKENETHSPSSVLEGWKNADKDIQGQLIDPSMTNPRIAAPATTESTVKAVTESTGKAATEKATEKTAGAKVEKPAAAAKPGAPAAAKTTAH